VDKFLNLFASGLVTGAIYSIMASGLVLTYTTSGIFNFAHGAVAFAVAYLYYQLHIGWNVPIVPALIISVFIFAPLMGLALDRILLRRLARAPAYARIVGTIGLLVMLPALIQWIFVTIFIKIFGWDLPGNTASTQGVPVPGIGPSPPHIYKPFAKLVLSSDQLAVFIVAAIAALVLWYVIRRTRLGLEMRAVVDRDTLAGLRGVNPARTSAVAWIMTMILAGLGGVLIAPLFTSSVRWRSSSWAVCARSRLPSPVVWHSVWCKTWLPVTRTASCPIR
jgi:branched-subunit amino acid ABC-type transport system permease component